MAKTISNRNNAAQLAMNNLPIVPGRGVDDQIYFSPPKGVNTTARLSQVPNNFSPSIVNLMLDEGYLRSRYGVESLSGIDDRTQAVLSFTPSDGGGVLIRLRLDGLDVWNGTDWVIVSQITFTGNRTDRFTWTGWGNELLITNGADKIVSFNVLSGEIKILTESSPARHITSFNGRVLASAVIEGAFYGYRVRWCEKLDNTQWKQDTTTDAIGAGYEDLLASPGGRVDEVMGCFPLSDETALMVRERSLWLVLTTGDVSAPFRFTRMTGDVGSRARHAIAITPYGVVVPSTEDIYVVDQSGPNSIGANIRRTLIPSLVDWPSLTGTYDPIRQEYRLVNDTDVYRYNFRDQGWTHDKYPFSIRDMHFADHKSLALTFDQAEGTFDDAQGTYDEAGITAIKEAVYLVNSSDGFAMRENTDLTKDRLVDSEIEIITALINDSNVLETTELIEAQLEYECDENQRLWFDYSTDKGATWDQYSYVDITPTTGPSVLRVTKTLVSHNLQIKVRATTLGKLSLISLHLFVVKGSMVRS